MRRKTKETRTEKINRYMLLTKKDVVIMLVDTQYALDQIVKKVNILKS